MVRHSNSSPNRSHITLYLTTIGATLKKLSRHTLRHLIATMVLTAKICEQQVSSSAVTVYDDMDTTVGLSMLLSPLPIITILLLLLLPKVTMCGDAPRAVSPGE